jgi:orotidine-5'-phosphate decarboxylase
VTSTAPLDRLRRRVAELGAPLCVGVDPHPAELPEEFAADASGVAAYARGLIEAVAPYAAAVKLNVAFYEAFGSAGWRALEEVRSTIPAELFVVLDAKRGDIGTTAERYAAALFGHLDADAVTLSPYLGEDAIEPFLAHDGKVVYVMARTSNPSAGRLQDLVLDGTPLHEHVARWVAGRWPDGRAGLVVGATAPADLRRLRAVVPAIPFLVPGVGAQGGDLEVAAVSCDGSLAPGLVSLSRAIAGASRGADWQEAAARAARDRQALLRGARARLAV